jgi:hypothetical protein
MEKNINVEGQRGRDRRGKARLVFSVDEDR